VSGVGQLTPARGAGGLRVLVGSSAPARLALAAVLLASLALGISACGRNDAGLGERVIPLGQPVPKGGGHYFVGEPYQIAGEWYRPHEDPSYNRVGKASWYGELFHGRRTANGEIYDMDRLSAAHPTLPLPIYAQVINLQNGRSIVVRVNDRGPYARDRIIDLSRRSAEVLGFRGHGTATVRVKYLSRAPLNGDDSYERRYLASQGWMQFAAKRKPEGGTQDPIAMAGLPGTGKSLVQEEADAYGEAAPVQTSSAADDVAALGWRTSLRASPEATGSTGSPAPPKAQKVGPPVGPLIQAGSFKNKDNADRARNALSAIAPVDVAEMDVAGEVYFRVRVGPFANEIEAEAALSRVTEAGYQGAKIIIRN
jgi:peptidoglycan lytic transglycosylase